MFNMQVLLPVRWCFTKHVCLTLEMQSVAKSRDRISCYKMVVLHCCNDNPLNVSEQVSLTAT